MTPIIDPFYIYLISRLDKILGICEVLCVVLFISTLLSTIMIMVFYIKDSAHDEFYDTTFSKAKTDLIYNAKRLKSLFENKLKLLEENNLDVEELREQSAQCCTILDDVRQQQEKLLVRIQTEKNRSGFYKKVAIRCFIGLWVVIFIKSLIPSTEVGYQLFIISYITPDNIGLVKNGAEELVQFIIDSIKQLR